jgi:hypothetical protein
MVQSGLRRTVGVWLYFIVGVKGLAVDWKLTCVLGFGNAKTKAGPPPVAKDDKIEVVKGESFATTQESIPQGLKPRAVAED